MDFEADHRLVFRSGLDESVCGHSHHGIIKGSASASPANGRQYSVTGTQLSKPDLLRYRDIEIHQLAATGIIDTADVYVGSGEWVGNASNVKEEKTRLGGVWFNRFGAELCGADFVHVSLANRPLHLLVRNGKRRWRRVRLRIGKPAVKIVRPERGQFGAIFCNQRDIESNHRNRLIAFICDNEKDWQYAALQKVDGENLGLLRRIVGIDSDGGLFGCVLVVRRVRIRRASRGPDEIFTLRKKSTTDKDDAHDRGSAQFFRVRHGPDYRSIAVRTRGHTV